MNSSSYANNLSVGAKLDHNNTRRLLQMELENQQLRRELQDAYQRIQLLEAMVGEKNCGSVSTTTASVTASVTSSVTTAITGSAKADWGRRRCNLEQPPPNQPCGESTASRQPRSSNRKKVDLQQQQQPLSTISLSSRTASDLTLASQDTGSLLLSAFPPSWSSSSRSVDTTTTKDWPNYLDPIALRYLLERIDSSDSDDVFAAVQS